MAEWLSVLVMFPCPSAWCRTEEGMLKGIERWDFTTEIEPQNSSLSPQLIVICQPFKSQTSPQLLGSMDLFLHPTPCVAFPAYLCSRIGILSGILAVMVNP